jgi:GntR family transcriptional regulator
MGAPAYLRVLEDLRAQILGGALAPGARVPSRNGIIAKYGVGETAAKHALQALATEGLIEARAGSGSYVRQAPAVRHLEHGRTQFPGSPFGLLIPAAAEGGATLSLEHQAEQARPPAHIARRLGLPAACLVTRTRYLLTADGVPVQLATSYQPGSLAARAPAPADGPFAGRTVAERMRAIGVHVDEIVEDVAARLCGSGEASALRVTPGTPVIIVYRDHHAAGRPVETSEIVIPAERFGLRYRFRLDGSGQA